MKTKLTLNIALLSLSTFATFYVAQPSTAHAQGTVFTYQGQVTDNSSPANGFFDITFSLWDAANGSAQVGGTVTNLDVAVTNGVFTVPLDFGAGNFNGPPRWLEIGVRPSSTGDFQTLSPRQPITAAPYAVQAGAVAAGAITSLALADGAVTSAKLAPGAVVQLGTPDGSDPNAVLVSTNGLVGVGTANPRAGLDISTGLAVLKAELIFEVANNTSSFTNLTSIENVAASGNLLAVASRSGSVTLVDVSDPLVPIVRSQMRNGVNGFNQISDPRRVALSGNLLIISARSSSAVTFVDVSDPDNPVKLVELVDGQGGWDNLFGAMGVAVSGNLLAITAEFDDAVTLADISNPAAPVKLAEIVNGQPGFANLDGPVSALISSSQLYVGAWTGASVTVADISNPASPVPLATLVNGVNGYGGLAGTDGLALSGNLLAIVGNASDRVTLVDVSQPAAPVKLVEFQNGSDGASFERAQVPVFFGNLLAVTDYSESTVTLYDVAAPTSPRLSLRFENGTDGLTLLDGAYGLTVAGTNLVVGGSQALVILGLSAGPETVSLVTAGRVGIGTNDPQAQLHVRGDAIVEGQLTTGGNVGLGTASPTPGIRLEVNGAALLTPGGSGGNVQIGSPNAETGMTIIGDARADIRFDGSTLKLLAGPTAGPPSSANGVAISTSGDVGIGKSLTVAGSILPSADAAFNSTLGSPVFRWYAVYSANGVFTTSDGRLKTGIKPLQYGMHELMQMRPVTFRWNTGDDPRTYLGLIAQEVEQVVPEVIFGTADPAAPLAINYASLLPVVIKAIQEQQASLERIQDFTKELNQKAEEITELKRRLERLERLIPGQTTRQPRSER